MNNPATMDTAALLGYIAALQDIQKTHRPSEKAWKTASELLAPCFAEMAEREPVKCTRKVPINSGKPWTRAADNQLRLLARHKDVATIAQLMGRAETGITARMERLNIVPAGTQECV